MRKLPLAPLAVFKLLRELRETTSNPRPIVVGGARELADALKRELVRGGDPTAVREGGLGALENAAALIYLLAGEPTEEDERALREAERAGVPVIVVGPDPRTPIPHVYATDILPLAPGEGFPIEELARLLGGKLDAEAAPLAARLPALRHGIAEAMIAKVARQNAFLGAAVFIPGVDFPVLTLNQLRLVLRLAAAYGQEIDAQRVPEILGVIGAGLGFRTFARQALGVIPIGGWAVKGGVAYAGTRALGEAAVRYFEARAASGGSGGPEPRATSSDGA